VITREILFDQRQSGVSLSCAELSKLWRDSLMCLRKKQKTLPHWRLHVKTFSDFWRDRRKAIFLFHPVHFTKCPLLTLLE